MSDYRDKCIEAELRAEELEAKVGELTNEVRKHKEKVLAVEHEKINVILDASELQAKVEELTNQHAEMVVEVHQKDKKVDELTDALQNLVDYYVKNPGTKSEFVTTASGGSDTNAKHVVLFREARAALKQEVSDASAEQCPVCGYYCLGNGGHGCIDKPSLLKQEVKGDN